jgi:hypothetical protein
MYKKGYSLMTITKVLAALKEGRVTIKSPSDEGRQKTNIKTIQSRMSLRTVNHRTSHLVRQMYLKEESVASNCKSVEHQSCGMS